jgi:purine nucleosidase
MSRPLLIDCDPGVDDAIALLLTFASPELHLLGITTVAGNVPLEMTQKNARRICELAGRVYVPVYAGCTRPLLRPLVTAEEVHGDDGLIGVDWPEVKMPLQPKHGVDFLIETLMAAMEPITIAALGPLTNLAIALIKEPRIIPKIRELVIMGGAIATGNITPSAEFNFYVDPHAAQVIFTSGLPLTLVPLDATHQVLTTPERLVVIRNMATPVTKAVAAMLTDYGLEEALQRGWIGAPLHDPCVIAYLIQPDLFTTQDLYMEVETGSPLTMGRTVMDEWGVTQRSPNVRVIRTVNAEGFYQLLGDRLARL